MGFHWKLIHNAAVIHRNGEKMGYFRQSSSFILMHQQIQILMQIEYFMQNRAKVKDIGLYLRTSQIMLLSYKHKGLATATLEAHMTTRYDNRTPHFSTSS